MSAEDGEEDTIRPRLEHAGADLDRVFLFDLIDDLGRSALPSITDHLAFIEQAIESTGAALVIVDPLFAFLGVEVNANRDQDVRRALSPVKALAERTGAAFAFLRHLNKAGGMPGLYRGGGSIGIIGAARFGLLIGKDEEDPDLRVLAVQKCNIGPEMPSLGYRLVGVPGTDVATVRWTGVVTHTATTLLDQGRTTEERGAREDAKHWLLDTLATNGDSVATKDLQKLARDAGVGWRTVETVKQAIGVKAEKGKDGWSWRLPLGPRLAAVKAAENESFTTQDRKEEGEISAPESEDRNTARPHETSREDDDDDPFEEDE
jgi:hypothetical protein